MKFEGEGQLLRVFIGENDQWHGKPLYEAIVERARRAGLAGATVLKGRSGFGAKSRMHEAKIFRLSEDLPVIVEIADSEDKIRDFLPMLDQMVGDGLISLEKVSVIAYRAERPRRKA